MRTARQTLIPLALALLAALASPLAHAGAGNELSKRTQLRYEDVLTTRDGSRWRGKIIQKGDIYRIRLEDKSEVAVLKENVMSEKGLGYVAANGSRIKNYRDTGIVGHTEAGDGMSAKIPWADVK